MPLTIQLIEFLYLKLNNLVIMQLKFLLADLNLNDKLKLIFI